MECKEDTDAKNEMKGNKKEKRTREEEKYKESRD